MNNIEINPEIKPTDKKDHYRFLINGVDLIGEQERSVFRHIIEVMDNGIEVGI
tara:strand:+ start:4884 stop:5042 length:159 start_codon:yes stop_codon:yes gene_type:complete